MMIDLSAKLTGIIVTTSMGLFLMAVAILCVIPLVQAAVEGRGPITPNLPAIVENLGLALALGGFTFRVTEISAIGVGLAFAGLAFGYFSQPAEPDKAVVLNLHPLLHKATLICGVFGVGALGEYYYIMS